MGEPEARESCPGQNNDLLAECWAYYRHAGYRLFQFSQYKKAIGDVVPDGDLSLDEGVPVRAAGDAWNHKYFLNADIPPTAIRAIQRNWRASALAGDDFYGDPAHPERQSERDLDAAERGLEGDRQLVLATRRYADAALREIPDVPDIGSTVRMRYESLRFLNPSSGSWRVWVVVSVRAGDLKLSSTQVRDAKRTVQGRLAVRADTGVTLEGLAAQSVRATISEDAGIQLRGVFTASPGAMPLTVVIEDANAPGSGAWIQDTINVPRIGGLPQLSDIAVAQSEGGTWTRDGETYLNVSPAHVTNPDGSIHAYFEVYGVDPGTRYDVEFRMVPSEAAERIWRIDPGDLAFRLQFSAQMPGDIGRHHLRLDLGDTKPGAYVLAVRIQDEKTKAYSLPSVTDIFIPDR